MASVAVESILDSINRRCDEFAKATVAIGRPLVVSSPIITPASLPVMAIPTPIDPKSQLKVSDSISIAIKDFLINTPTDYGIQRSALLVARFLNPWGRVLYWSDLCVDPTDSEKGLHVRLGDLLDCGMSISDVIVNIPKCSYQQLRHTFRFNPADLCKNFMLFNLSHLVQYFKVGYAELLVDYGVGIYDYFVELNLALTNINRFNITVELGMNWRKEYKKIYADKGKLTPESSGVMDSRMSKALVPLDRDMLHQRYKKRKALKKRNMIDTIGDWVTFLNLTLEQLYAMDVTRHDIDKWWLDPVGMEFDAFIDLFSTKPEKIVRYYREPQVTKVVPTSSPSSPSTDHSPRHHRRRDDRSNNSPSTSNSNWRSNVPSVWDKF